MSSIDSEDDDLSFQTVNLEPNGLQKQYLSSESFSSRDTHHLSTFPSVSQYYKSFSRSAHTRDKRNIPTSSIHRHPTQPLKFPIIISPPLPSTSTSRSYHPSTHSQSSTLYQPQMYFDTHQKYSDAHRQRSSPPDIADGIAFQLKDNVKRFSNIIQRGFPIPPPPPIDHKTTSMEISHHQQLIQKLSTPLPSGQTSAPERLLDQNRMSISSSPPALVLTYHQLLYDAYLSIAKIAVDRMIFPTEFINDVFELYIKGHTPTRLPTLWSMSDIPKLTDRLMSKPLNGTFDLESSSIEPNEDLCRHDRQQYSSSINHQPVNSTMIHHRSDSSESGSINSGDDRPDVSRSKRRRESVTTSRRDYTIFDESERSAPSMISKRLRRSQEDHGTEGVCQVNSCSSVSSKFTSSNIDPSSLVSNAQELGGILENRINEEKRSDSITWSMNALSGNSKHHDDSMENVIQSTAGSNIEQDVRLTMQKEFLNTPHRVRIMRDVSDSEDDSLEMIDPHEVRSMNFPHQRLIPSRIPSTSVSAGNVIVQASYMNPSSDGRVSSESADEEEEGEIDDSPIVLPDQINLDNLNSDTGRK